MIERLVFLLGVMSFTLPNTVQALTLYTGEELQRVCSAVDRFTECVSYLEMVYRTVKAVDRMSEPQLKGVIGSCGPEKGIDTVPLPIALRLAWQEYAKKHPDRLQRQAVEEVLLAFEERWPCKK